MMDLKTIVTTTKLDIDEIGRRVRAIYGRLLQESRYVRTGNFQSIHPDDLKTLFASYDEIFFNRTISQSLGETPLDFRLSRRLTSCAGKTTRWTRRKPQQALQIEYEISISTTLLFQTFRDVDRVVTTSGVECHDRIEALQRVFEHELVHLVELLVWNKSQCTRPRFQTISNRLFGHREHTHQLITQSERALAKFGLRVGDKVTFRVDSRQFHGIINKITRRATVLVENANGTRYTDGKRYLKFYIPLDMLLPASKASFPGSCLGTP